MNIIDFVEKNGIYSLEERAFCEVDSLIISQLVYLKFEGIVPSISAGSDGIVLKDIISHEKYNNIYRDERYAEINSKFFVALCESKRFGNLILNNFIDVIDNSLDIQFSAMTISDGSDFKYVVFRGTDDSLVGWKEDLNMTFKTPVPAQKYSVEYLEKVAAGIDGDFYVGGHSKGGNLAVYSSMNCGKNTRERIIRIFSHDGPGFRKELLHDSCYDEIKDRIIKFVPHSAVVGMFGNVEDFYVVDCEKMGVKQHNPYNWIVEDFKFKYVDHVGKYSVLRADAINSWAAEVTEEQWAMLSDKIFGVFDAAGVTNLNEFNEDFWGTLTRIRIAADEVDEESREQIRSIFARFRETASLIAKEEAKENVQSAERSLIHAKNVTVETVQNVTKKTTAKKPTAKKPATKKTTAKKTTAKKTEK